MGCMPRTARAIVGGQCYHVINRTNNGEPIFRSHGCYLEFLALLAEAQERLPLPLLAACLMPNHVHFVVRPERDADIAHWTQWVFTTHVRRHHARERTYGRIWQGRFKAFVIQQDNHLLTVLRYVERNALRSGLVARAEDWPWGSLQWRLQQQRLTLTSPPISLPEDWAEYVNRPQTSAELAAIRACVNRQRPFGSSDWVVQTAQDLGLMQSLTNIGRPPKRETLQAWPY